MISAAEARAKIIEVVEPLTTSEIVPLRQLFSRVLKEDIYAPFPLPAFRQTSVDGYGVCGLGRNSWNLIGESRSGKSYVEAALKPGEALRIFTGSEVPDEVATMLMQEDAVVFEGVVETALQLNVGSHIREVGSHTVEGQKIFKKGHLFTPTCVGLVASLGIANARVQKKPKINLLVTGDELIEPGERLTRGTVYESNSFALEAALHSTGYSLERPPTEVPDELHTLTKAVSELVGESDVLLVSGGISVGDYDFVARAVELSGGDVLFHNVSQRPGKPFYFGRRERCLIFGLPGNPASALVCFYEYVLTALRILEGRADTSLPTERRTLRAGFKKPSHLTCFLKGAADQMNVSCLDGQESYKTLPLSAANVLIVGEIGREEYRSGEDIEVHLLPHFRS